MDTSKDYYAVLGVLPSAEAPVVRAAYRALAQLYHPDRFAGDLNEANRRMVELNEAYEVLSNDQSRKQYDLARGHNPKSGNGYFAENSDETPPERDPLQRDWSIALKYHPDLDALEKRLRIFSWRLAYAYRAQLLDSQTFGQRVAVAAAIENQFLQTYFGVNPRIVDFARDLIVLGRRDAAKELNDAVRVFGADIDAEKVMSRVKNDFSLVGSENPERFRKFAEQLRRWGTEQFDIEAQLRSRGLSESQAAALARMVCAK